MGVLDDFDGAIVGLDTTPLIYFIEKNATYHPLVRRDYGREKIFGRNLDYYACRNAGASDTE